MKMNENHSACENKTKETLFKIGAFAQMNRMTVKALRFYESEGLLIPAFIDDDNNYRYYTLSQMADVHRIVALKEAGFTLDDIKKLNRGDNTQAILSNRKAEILSKIAELTRMLAVIDGNLFENNVNSPVLVKTIPNVLVAKSDITLNSYDDLFTEMPRLGETMEKLGLECRTPEYCYTEYLEPGYQDENIKVSICQSIVKKKEEKAGIYYEETGEVLAACIYHKGSYANFPDSYSAVLKYIDSNDYEICGNIREVYIDGIWNKNSIDDWLSEIQIPVRKK